MKKLITVVCMIMVVACNAATISFINKTSYPDNSFSLHHGKKTLAQGLPTTFTSNETGLHVSSSVYGTPHSWIVHVIDGATYTVAPSAWDESLEVCASWQDALGVQHHQCCKHTLDHTGLCYNQLRMHRRPRGSRSTAQW